MAIELIKWSPMRSVIMRMIYYITDRIGQHEVLLPTNHNFNKICGHLSLLFLVKHKIIQGFNFLLQ